MPEPFVKYPFKTGVGICITEGWLYSDEEKAVHGYETHFGVDFAVPRGTPVYAMAKGFAIASYHLAYAGEYQGKRVGFGLGKFVQIWHPDAGLGGLFTSYGHLADTAGGIAYYAPQQKGEGWDPTILYQPVEVLLQRATRVKRGDLIGYVGDTGLSWGYNETPHYRPNPQTHPAWDEIHLHIEVYSRDAEGKKQNRYDPFGIYGTREQYDPIRQTEKGLWLTGPKQNILYVR